MTSDRQISHVTTGSQDSGLLLDTKKNNSRGIWGLLPDISSFVSELSGNQVP